ncbi:FtsX-like permease family protein [Microbacterium sp. P07]|uniref:FtsX-like permease family protein n=1 Tax=Microbacterium sp. P07 TaxID=3366952 RepID=UPI003745C086
MSRRLRLLSHRIGPHLAPLVLTAVLIAVLVAGASGLPRALAIADDARVAAALDSTRSSAAEIVLATEWADAEGADAIIKSLSGVARSFPTRLAEPLGGAIGGRGWNVVLDAVDIDEPRPGGDVVKLRLGVDSDALTTASVIDGNLPAASSSGGRLEIALTRTVAEELGVAVGHVFSSGGLELVVAGIVDPAPGDAVARVHRAVFLDVAREPLLNGSTVLTAGVWIDPESLSVLDGFVLRAQLTAWYQVSAESLRASDVEALSTELRAAVSGGATLSNGQSLSVTSRLASILDRVVAAQSSTSALVGLLSSGAFGAIVVAAGIAAGAFADRRAPARRLLAARGAGFTRSFVDGAVETAVAVIPGAALGAIVAVAAIPGPVGPDALVAPVIVAVGATLGGALLATPLPPAWRRPVRVGADILFAVLGVGAAVSLTTARGFAATGASVDPFVVSAPVWIGIAGGIGAARMLPLALVAVERARRRTASAASSVAAAWAARRPAAVAPLVAIVVALSACVSSLVVGQTLADALTVAARDSVGADARIVGGEPSLDAVRSLAGIESAVTVSTLDAARLTDDGRSRAAEIFAADTAALHPVRPDLPVLQPGEVAAAPSLSDALSGAVEIGGAGIAAGESEGVDTGGASTVALRARIVDASLPVPDGRWVLVDDSTLGGPIVGRSSFILIRFTSDPPADVADRLREIAGPDATVLVVSEERAAGAARPAAVMLTGVLLAGALIPILLAALAVAASVTAGGAERARMRAVLRLLGLPPRGRSLPVLWQVVPVVLAGSLAGGVVGIAVSALIASVADVTQVAGADLALRAAPPFPWAAVALAVAGGAVFLTASGLLASLPGARRSRRAPARNGAAS